MTTAQGRLCGAARMRSARAGRTGGWGTQLEGMRWRAWGLRGCSLAGNPSARRRLGCGGGGHALRMLGGSATPQAGVWPGAVVVVRAAGRARRQAVRCVALKPARRPALPAALRSPVCPPAAAVPRPAAPLRPPSIRSARPPPPQHQSCIPASTAAHPPHPATLPPPPSCRQPPACPTAPEPPADRPTAEPLPSPSDRQTAPSATHLTAHLTAHLAAHLTAHRSPCNNRHSEAINRTPNRTAYRTANRTHCRTP